MGTMAPIRPTVQRLHRISLTAGRPLGGLLEVLEVLEVVCRPGGVRLAAGVPGARDARILRRGSWSEGRRPFLAGLSLSSPAPGPAGSPSTPGASVPYRHVCAYREPGSPPPAGSGSLTEPGTVQGTR